jgi:hypothetical protein
MDVWEGPVENWIRACDRIPALDVEVVVPGHGPLTDKEGVRLAREYWEGLLETCLQSSGSGSSESLIGPHSRDRSPSATNP